MSAATDTRTITATIARVNGSGFTTQEQPQTWLNLSKYATPAPTIPPAGAQVRLVLDGSGFVRAIKPVATAPSPTASSDGLAAAMPPSKDTAIVRMAAVKAA